MREQRQRFNEASRCRDVAGDRRAGRTAPAGAKAKKARRSEVEVAERNGARRRTWRDIAQDGDADDEGDREQEDGLEEGEDVDDEDGIDEDEVQRAIHENRGETLRSS